MRTLELVTFSIRISADEFLAANREIDAWLGQRQGFLFRHLAEKQDGTWIDAVGWATLGDAEAASQALMSQLLQSPAMQAIDPDSIVMSHAAIRSPAA